MQRLRRAAFPLALVAALGLTAVVLVEDSAADLDNGVFTSRTEHLRLIVPRGWRSSDLPTYPGLLLWMARSQPPGQIELTTETFTRELYCSWPVSCRASHEGLPSQYACALRAKLEAQHLKVDSTQAGPKENEAANLASIWFEYNDGKHFLRHAIAFSGQERAISLVLSAPTSAARAAHIRAFEQALRSLYLLSPEETARAIGIDAAVAGVPGDASLIDSGLLPDAAPDAGVLFESAPAPKINPVGPCP